MLLSTNIIFLKHDYINNNKPQSKVLLKELKSNGIKKEPPVGVDTRPKNHGPIQFLFLENG